MVPDPTRDGYCRLEAHTKREISGGMEPTEVNSNRFALLVDGPTSLARAANPPQYRVKGQDV
jgi:hypothetical protein